MVNCVGYHGTSKESAVSILKNDFNLSMQKNEWLGFGVYFFDQFEWANSWARKKKSGVVVSAKLQCMEEEFYDLDDSTKMQLMVTEAEDVLKKQHEKKPNMRQNDLRCFACNFFGEKHNIKIFAYTFPSLDYNVVYFPVGEHKERQYCVRHTQSIINKYITNDQGEGVSLDAI